MIDLEDALSSLVELAPAPPDVERIARRGRSRRRRRVAALASTLVLVAAVAIGAFATIANHGSARVAGVAGDVDHVRFTLLDGSQLEIRGPSSLGLTRLPPEFNGELDFATSQSPFPESHSFTVSRHVPTETGVVVGTYPTADGHELVVHEAPHGVDAVVAYGPWTLVVHWSQTTTDWVTFANALEAHLSADGFLVVEPHNGWAFGPTDGPDLQLGDSYAFFGPSTYPAGCPNEAPDHYTRCYPSARVRVGAVDRALGPDLADLQVSYTDADHEVDQVTALDGSRYEITAPSSVLDHLILQATIAVDGLDTTSPIDVQATRDKVDLAPPTYATADGNRFGVVHSRDTDPSGAYLDWWLVGQYGDWTVMIDLTGTPVVSEPPAARETDLTRIASLFAAHETADGFLALAPRAPMHIVPGPAAEIVLDQVSIITSLGEPRVEPARADVHVRRLP